MYDAMREYRASVRVNGKPVTEVVHNDMTFIEGRVGSEYTLFFENHSSKRVKVIPSVDGLCVLDGEPAGVNSPGYVVDSHKSIDIPGWKVDRLRAAKFKFAPQGSKKAETQTYVEAIGADETNQGTIGFLVFQEKTNTVKTTDRDWLDIPVIPPISPPPYVPGSPSPWECGPWLTYDSTGDAPHMNRGITTSTVGASLNIGVVSNSIDVDNRSKSALSTRRVNTDWFNIEQEVDTGVGTAFGDSTSFKTERVEFEAEHPHSPDAVMVFYYDTLRGLKRRGVPTDAFSPKSYQTEPNPFPGSPSIMGSGCKPPAGWKG